jgi:hypothetical protein
MTIEAVLEFPFIFLQHAVTFTRMYLLEGVTVPMMQQMMRINRSLSEESWPASMHGH